MGSRGALSQLGQLHLPRTGQHQALLLLHHRYERAAKPLGSAHCPPSRSRGRTAVGWGGDLCIPSPSLLLCMLTMSRMKEQWVSPCPRGHQHVPCMKPPALLSSLSSPTRFSASKGSDGGMEPAGPGCSLLPLASLPSIPKTKPRWHWGAYHPPLTPTPGHG